MPCHATAPQTSTRPGGLTWLPPPPHTPRQLASVRMELASPQTLNPAPLFPPSPADPSLMHMSNGMGPGGLGGLGMEAGPMQANGMAMRSYSSGSLVGLQGPRGNGMPMAVPGACAWVRWGQGVRRAHGSAGVKGCGGRMGASGTWPCRPGLQRAGAVSSRPCASGRLDPGDPNAPHSTPLVLQAWAGWEAWAAFLATCPPRACT